MQRFAVVGGRYGLQFVRATRVHGAKERALGVTTEHLAVGDGPQFAGPPGWGGSAMVHRRQPADPIAEHAVIDHSQGYGTTPMAPLFERSLSRPDAAGYTARVTQTRSLG